MRSLLIRVVAGTAAIAGSAVLLAAPAQAAAVSCTSVGTKLDFGQGMGAGKCITSTGGAFVLVMQTDGNLVTYRKSTSVACWAAGTSGSGMAVNVGSVTNVNGATSTRQISLLVANARSSKTIVGSTEPSSTYQNISVNSSGVLYIGYAAFKTWSC